MLVAPHAHLYSGPETGLVLTQATLPRYWLNKYLKYDMFQGFEEISACVPLITVLAMAESGWVQGLAENAESDNLSRLKH